MARISPDFRLTKRSGQSADKTTARFQTILHPACCTAKQFESSPSLHLENIYLVFGDERFWDTLLP